MREKPVPLGREELARPEQPSQQDFVAASLYRTVLLLEREQEMTSGMMYRPDAEGLTHSLEALTDFEERTNYLSDNQLEQIRNTLLELFDRTESFQGEKLRWRYDTSYPASPSKEMAPNELCRFVPPMQRRRPDDGPPWALVYLTNTGELHYQLCQEVGPVVEAGREMIWDEGVRAYRPSPAKAGSGVFELGTQDLRVEKGSLGKIPEFPTEVISNLLRLLRSEEFQKHWDSLQDKLSKGPPTPLYTVQGLI